MPAVSELLVRIDATTESLRRELQRAGASLNSFESTAEKSMKQVDNSFSKLGRSLGGIQNALGAVGVAFGGIELARGFIELSDTATTVQNKLRSVSGSAEELKGAYDALYASSQENAISIEASVSLYARLMNALERTGMTSAEVVEIVDTLGKTAKISGMSAAETAAAMGQLSQAFNSGFLMGEEFNTMAEAMPSLLNAVAEEMAAVTGQPFEEVRASLKDMAADSEVSLDVLIAAIRNMREETVRDFSQIESTVADATTRMWNSLTDFVGKLSDVTGASDGVRDKIDDLASAFSFGAGVIETYGGSISSMINILDQVPTPLETLISLAKVGHEELQKLINFAQQAAGQVAAAGQGIMAGARQPSPAMRLGMTLGKQYEDEVNAFLAPAKNVMTAGGAGGVHPGAVDWTVSKEIQDAWGRFNKDVTARAMGKEAPAPTNAQGELVVEINKGTATPEGARPKPARPWQPPKVSKEDQRAVDSLRKSTQSAKDEYQSRVSEIDDLMARGMLSQHLYTKALNDAADKYQKAIAPKKTGGRGGKSEAQRKADEQKREVERLREATRTPREEYQAEVAELDELRKSKKIDEDLYRRGLAAAEKDYQAAMKPKGGGGRAKKPEEDKEQERAERQGAVIFEETRTGAEDYGREVERLSDLLRRGAIDQETYDRAVAEAGFTMQEQQMTFRGSQDAARAYLDEIARLDGQLAAGAISQDEYNIRVLEAQQKYADAQSNSAAYADEITRLDKALAEGKISQEEYAASVDLAATSMSKAAQEGAALTEEMRTPLERYREEMAKLNELWEGGAIGDETKMRKATQLMNEYHEELLSTNSSMQRMRDMSDDLGLAIAGSFEDAIVEGGKLRDILDNLWKDIQRIVIRQLVTIPLASGISAMIGGVMGVPGAGRFQHGGEVRGKGGVDNVPAMLTAGEFVVNPQSTKRHRAMLEAINDNRIGSMGSIPKFAAGGIVGSIPHFAAGGFVGSGSSASAPIEIKLENKSSTPLKLESQSQRKAPNGGHMISVMVTDAVKAALNAGEFDKGMSSRYGASVQPIGR